MSKFPLLLVVLASPAIAGQPSPFVALPWTPHGTTSQARYGAVVAPAGDVNGDGYRDVLVSAPKEEGPNTDAGKVYLYLGSVQGLAASAAWSWSANQVNGATGVSAAAAGDVNGDGYDDVVIGTPQWNAPGPIAMAGKISVFHGGPAGLPAVPTYERLAPTPIANARFGFAVGTAGNVNGDNYADVIVGAPFHTSGGLTGRGAAYVFHGGAAGLGAAPALTLLGAEAGANQGKAVSTAGDVDADGYADVLVGAPFASQFGVHCGTASLFRGSGAGVLAVADTVLGGEFELEEVGGAVANAGDVNGDGYADVLIGSPGYSNGAPNRGGYAVLLGGPGGLEAIPALVRHLDNDGERLGACVATIGDINADGYSDFAAGAPADSMEFPQPRIELSLGGPVLGFPFQELSGSASATHYGFSIATAGDADGDGFSEFLVGDPGASVVGSNAEGTAVLYEFRRSVPAILPEWPCFGGTSRGAAVAIAPGLGGSGYPSLVSGEPAYNFGGPDCGFLMVQAGAKGSIPISIAHSEFGEAAGDRFAAGLTDAGDLDRDGFTDVLIASPNNSTGGNQAGRVSLMRGSVSGGTTSTILLEGDQALEHLGSAMAGRGDVDGDGYHDVLIGAPQWDGPGLPDCGKVWLLYGAPGGIRIGPWTAQGTIAGQGLGANVSIGDMDADGYSDVVVSSVSPLAVNPPSGKVAVYYGGPSGPASSPAWEVASNEPSSTFGTGLAAVGDISGDGICDLVVGAPQEGGNGRIYIYKSDGGRGKLRAWLNVSGTQAGARFGAVISGRGDVDGDGIGDFVAGEPRYDGGAGADVGRVHLFYGNAAEPVAAWSFEGVNPLLELGSAISSLVDVNLDGFADFAVGAPRAEGGDGGVWVFLGGGGLGVERVVMLEKEFSANPLLYYPIRIASNGVARALFYLRSAEGRGKVSMQAETHPINIPFNGTPSQTVGPLDTGTPSLDQGSMTGIITSFDLPWMGIAYKTRMRSRSASPFFPGSRWIRAEAHSEGDFDFYRGGVQVAVPGSGLALAPRLSDVSPNPASATTHIGFELPRAMPVTVEVFDVRGARVRRLVDESRPAGSSSATWDGRDESGRTAPPGLYFVLLTAETVVDRARLVRL